MQELEEGKKKHGMKLLIAGCLWGTWSWRNAGIFRDQEIGTNTRVIIIKNYMREINSAFSNQTIVEGGLGTHHNCLVRREPPCIGWYKLNTYGFCKGRDKSASAGGIIRDNKGCWIEGFSIKLGSCSETEAEIWAVIYGLRMAWDQGIQRLVVEFDSSPVAKWLNTKEKGSGRTRNLMEECIRLIQQQREVVIKHVYCEANQVADDWRVEILDKSTNSLLPLNPNGEDRNLLGKENS